MDTKLIIVKYFDKYLKNFLSESEILFKEKEREVFDLNQKLDTWYSNYKNDKNYIEYILKSYNQFDKIKEYVEKNDSSFLDSENVFLILECNINYSNSEKKLNEKNKIQILKYLKFLILFSSMLHDIETKSKEWTLEDIKSEIEKCTDKNKEMEKELNEAKEKIKSMTGDNSHLNEMIDDITDSLGDIVGKKDDESEEDILKNLLGNGGGNLMSIFGNIKNKYENKISNGEINPQDMLKSMQGMIGKVTKQTRENVKKESNPMVNMMSNMMENNLEMLNKIQNEENGEGIESQMSDLMEGNKKMMSTMSDSLKEVTKSGPKKKKKRKHKGK